MLKSFSFGSYLGYSEVPKEVWSLFLEMSENPTKPVQYVSEVVRAAMLGRIDMDATFCLGAYCSTISENLKLKSFSNLKKEVYLDDSPMQDSGNQNTYGYVSLERASLVQNMKDEFDNILDSDELSNALKHISSYKERVLLDYGLDLYVLLRNSVKGVPAAVSNLRQLCLDCEELAESIKIILTSGESLEDCLCY